MSSLADRIRALDDLKRSEIDVPEWADALDGQALYVREMSGADQVALSELETDFDIAVFVVLRCVVDESGARVFDDTAADWLREKNAAVLLRIATEAAGVSGLSPDALEDAVGN